MVDGVRLVFQMAPGTEAPSEMLFDAIAIQVDGPKANFAIVTP